MPTVAPGLKRRRDAAAPLSDRDTGRSPQPLRIPGAVQLLGRAAPLGVDRARTGARLGRAARCRRVRADQSAGPEPLASGFRGDLVLQDVRLANRRRLSDRSSRRSRQAKRPWFSGGTIVAAFVQRQNYQSAPGAAHFEDGTVVLRVPRRDDHHLSDSDRGRKASFLPPASRATPSDPTRRSTQRARHPASRWTVIGGLRPPSHPRSARQGIHQILAPVEHPDLARVTRQRAAKGQT